MRRPRDSKDGIRVRRGWCQMGKVVLPAMGVIQCRSQKSRGRPQEQRLAPHLAPCGPQCMSVSGKGKEVGRPLVGHLRDTMPTV